MRNVLITSLALTLGLVLMSQPASAGPRKRTSIEVIVGCDLDGNTLKVTADAEQKVLGTPEPVITDEVVVLTTRIGRDIWDAATLYDTNDGDALVAFADLPIQFEVDLCSDPSAIAGAKALGVRAEITIANASVGGQTDSKTFSAQCKVVGLPTCP